MKLIFALLVVFVILLVMMCVQIVVFEDADVTDGPVLGIIVLLIWTIFFQLFVKIISLLLM